MTFAADRYEQINYRRCGKSGLKLPEISLGCWHNFGHAAPLEPAKQMLYKAFDLGITHFDLANNYGPPAGSAESRVGEILKNDFAAHRDELIISSKAGYVMWPGPYGDFGSKKFLIASCEQSLKRLQLDYVDIFYHHRPDPETPLEESMGALEQLHRQGKALYVGISSYSAESTRQAAAVLKDMGVPLLIHQPSYSPLNRGIENGLREACDDNGVGIIAFCPLQQGQLTSKYINGIPDDSRAGRGGMNKDAITPELVAKLKKLNAIAENRGQSLAQMALQWVLRDLRVTSALIGASKVSQIEENVAGLKSPELTDDELKSIDDILAS